MSYIKILIGEWSRQKIKGCHLINVDKVGRSGRCHGSVVVCYDTSVPHWLSLILTMCI
jgi:hypothetical protein